MSAARDRRKAPSAQSTEVDRARAPGLDRDGKGSDSAGGLFTFRGAVASSARSTEVDRARAPLDRGAQGKRKGSDSVRNLCLPRTSE